MADGIHLVDRINAVCVRADDGRWLFLVEDGQPCVSEHYADLRTTRDRVIAAGFTCKIRELRFAPKGETQDATDTSATVDA